jgi:hypothetical protein
MDILAKDSLSNMSNDNTVSVSGQQTNYQPGPCAWLSEPYGEQEKIWPQEGKHILAQYDDETIVVYQAFNHKIADYAVKHQW